MENKKTFSRKLVGALCFINLISFLVYYLTTYVFEGAVSAYVFYFYTEIVRFVLPIASALAIFVTYAKASIGKCFLHTLFYTLPWLIYLFPYNAYKYAYGGLVIEDVFIYASLETLFILAMLYLVSLVLSFIMIFAAHLLLSRKKAPFKKSAVLIGDDPLDFNSPSAIGIFSGCFTLFLYNLIREIIDTVDFIGYADGVYENAEIIYMVFKYVFILGMLLASYFAAHRMKRSLT